MSHSHVCQLTEMEEACITQEADSHCLDYGQLHCRCDKFVKESAEYLWGNWLLLDCSVSEDMLCACEDLLYQRVIGSVFYYCQLMCP